MRRRRFTLLPLACLLIVSACHEPPLPFSPDTLGGDAAFAASRGATREVFEFDVPVSTEFFAPCVGEVVRVQGSTHVVLDVTTTPAGVVITRVFDQLNPGTFVERANVVRYFLFNYQGHTNTIEGPVTVVNSTGALIVESAAGDRLNLSVHYQMVRNAAGDLVVDKFVGACGD